MRAAYLQRFKISTCIATLPISTPPCLSPTPRPSRGNSRGRQPRQRLPWPVPAATRSPFVNPVATGPAPLWAAGSPSRGPHGAGPAVTGRPRGAAQGGASASASASKAGLRRVRRRPPGPSRRGPTNCPGRLRPRRRLSTGGGGGVGGTGTLRREQPRARFLPLNRGSASAYGTPNAPVAHN